MSTGSAATRRRLPAMELRGLQLGYPPPAAQRQPRPALPLGGPVSRGRRTRRRRKRGRRGRCAAGGPAGGCKRSGLRARGASGECKQSQRNAANARERARMRVLSKAFSRLKTSLPWVPPDTKLSKLDTLRLASSYIAHLRQLLQEDRYENGYVHPVNLTWPFVVSGRPESDTKEVSTANRLCGTTA
uniref:Musculin n=1 Tax=Chelonoidis abingdonii TaxID=106734 RepID=A0A8C0H7R1_CHEAB